MVRATKGLKEVLVFPWLCLLSHWTRSTVSLSSGMSFSLSLSLLSHTLELIIGMLWPPGTSLTSLSPFPVHKPWRWTKAAERQFEFETGPQQKHAAPKRRNFRRHGASYWELALRGQKKQKCASDTIQPTSSMYCKDSSYCRGRGREGWQSLKVEAVDTRGPAGRTVEQQLAVKTHPYNTHYTNKQEHIQCESGRVWTNPMVEGTVVCSSSTWKWGFPVVQQKPLKWCFFVKQFLYGKPPQLRWVGDTDVCKWHQCINDPYSNDLSAIFNHTIWVVSVSR